MDLMRNSKILSILAVLIGSATVVGVFLVEKTPSNILYGIFGLTVAYALGVIAYMKFRGNGSLIRFCRRNGIFGVPQPIVLVSGLVMVLLLRLGAEVTLSVRLSDDLTLLLIVVVLGVSFVHGIIRYLKQCDNYD